MLQNTTKRQKGHENVNKYKLIMFIDDFLISCFEMSRHHSRAVRRRHCVGGGAPVNFGRRRRAGQFRSAAAARPPGKKIGGGGGATRRGVGGQKQFFSKIHEKMSFYPQNFLRNFFSHQSFEVCR